MAGLARKLFVNWHTKRLQVSDKNGTPVDPPTFQKSEVVPLHICIVEPCAPWGPSNFQKVDISAISLTVAFGDVYDDTTPLASQSSWTKNTSTNTFEGELSLNTVLMNTHIGSSETKSAYFEIECMEGAAVRTKIYTQQVTLRASVLPSAAVSPEPAVEYLTRQQTLNLCIPRIMGPGDTITFKSPGNTVQRVLGVNDDGTGQDDYGQI